MNSYRLIVNHAEILDALSLRVGDAVTPTCFVKAIEKDEEGNMVALHLKTQRDSGHGVGSSTKVLTLKCGQTIGYIYHSLNGNGPFDNEEDAKAYEISLYEILSDGVFEFHLDASGIGYVCVGIQTNAEEIVIPNSFNGLPVTRIGFTAFENNIVLTKATLPASIEAIEERGFIRCKRLKEVVIQGEKLYSIGDNAFALCQSLKEIRLPESVVQLGEGAFRDCALTHIDIPPLVGDLSRDLFLDCMKLESVAIPEGVEAIQEGCFQGTWIESIALPSTLLYLDVGAFRNGWVHAPTLEITFNGNKDRWPGDLEGMREYLTKIKVVHCLDGDIE